MTDDTHADAREGDRDAIVAATGPVFLPDEVVTQVALERRLEADRRRHQRMILWIGTIFALALLAAVALVLSLSIYVVRDSQAAVGAVEDLSARTFSRLVEFEGEMDQVAADIDAVQERAGAVAARVERDGQMRERERQGLRSDLERFSEWTGGETARLMSEVQRMTQRLSQVERESQRRAQLIETLETRLAAAAFPADDLSRGFHRNGDVGPIDDHAASLLPSAASETAPPPAQSPPPKPAGPVSVVQLPNGDRYEGELRDGMFDGAGTYIAANGDRYEGEFRKDHRHGQGMLVFRNGDRYTGRFREDKIDGVGTFVFQNGDRYEGAFRQGLRHGYGTYTYHDGGRYVGEFRDGVRHGKGRYEYRSGGVYEGDFVNGRKEGRGIYRGPDGAILEGRWAADRFLGE